METSLGASTASRVTVSSRVRPVSSADYLDGAHRPPSVHRDFFKNGYRCGVCEHDVGPDEEQFSVTCCARGKRWICSHCIGIPCRVCGRAAEAHLEQLSSDSEDSTASAAEPDAEPLPRGKLLVLFDINGTLAFQPKEGDAQFGVDAVPLVASDLPAGYHGYPTQLFHRRYADKVLKLLDNHRDVVDWGFYTTKSMRNALPMANAILEHAVPTRAGQPFRPNADSGIWLFDQACCEFVKPSDPEEGYRHGDVGGAWIFDLSHIQNCILPHAYKRVIVVAGSHRKLMRLPDRNKLLCTDFSGGCVRDPDEQGLEEVFGKLALLLGEA